MPPTLTSLKRGDAGIVFAWDDGLEAELSPWTLRVHCPCALCVSEATGRRILDPATVPEDVGLKDMQPVGRYAYRCLFGDDHDTGIYTLDALRRICEEASPSR